MVIKPAQSGVFLAEMNSPAFRGAGGKMPFTKITIKLGTYLLFNPKVSEK